MELKKLGVYGCEALQELVAAAILTGDPVLFVGDKGTAKTFMMEQIAKALGLKFIAYNCSSANFDDIVGFPMPNKEKTRMEFLPTPTSIWGVSMVMLDEINRARLDIQNNYFQLIRNRSVQGKRVDTLKWVFAAMNPLSYAGTTPLDPALADRFAWLIRTPSFSMIQEKDRHSIINNTTVDDSPALNYWGNPKIDYIDNSVKQDFAEWFHRAAKIYNQYLLDCDDVIAYVDDFSISVNSALKDKSQMIEGRRAGILLRNILALTAVRDTYGLAGGIEAAAGRAIFHSFIDEAVESAISKEVLTVAHEKAKHLLRKSISSVMDEIERLPTTIQKISVGLKNNVDPVAMGGWIAQHFGETSDPVKIAAFAFSIWPYLKNANVTNDALALVTSAMKPVFDNLKSYKGENNNKLNQYIKYYRYGTTNNMQCDFNALLKFWKSSKSVKNSGWSGAIGDALNGALSAVADGLGQKYIDCSKDYGIVSWRRTPEDKLKITASFKSFFHAYSYILSNDFTFLPQHFEDLTATEEDEDAVPPEELS